MMKKSLLVASVLAATTGVALAANNTSTYCKSGFYAGLQGGRGDTFYKPSQVLNQAASEDAGTSVSTTNNYYNGLLQNSAVTTTWGTTTLYDQDVDDSGAAGRLYAGYQFNPYFAIEAGYTQFNKTSFSATSYNLQDSQTVTTYPNGTPANVSDVTQTTSTSGVEGDLTEHAVDVVAKATLPLQYGFGVYVKAGMAFIQANRYINVNDLGTSTSNAPSYRQGSSSTSTSSYTTATSSNNGINEQGTLYDKTYQAFRPTYGAGIDYTIPNTNMDVEVFYSEIAGDKAIRTASLWGAGIAYKFA